MATDKDTIYIDIDDEITGIIDKLKASKSKVVALVLPKRASVFQSIVNMKLLKKAADSTSKNIVLITAEAGLLPLAGAAGIHVAKTIASKPEIPSAPIPFKDSDDAVDEDAELAPGEPEAIDPKQTVGELAGAGAAATAIKSKDGVETIALDNEDAAVADDKTPDKADAAKSKAAKKDKKLKVPNFERFRKWLIIGVILLILIIGGLIFANGSLAKATINIKTNAQNVNANLSLALSTSAGSVSTASGTIPANLAQQQKTFSEQVGTTGQENNGNKASGSVTMTAQECAPNLGQPPDVAAGTGLSSNGLTYITQTDTSFSGFGTGKGNCQNYQATSSTTIIAQNGGSTYNGATSFTVAGRSDITNVSVNSSITGGTDNIVQTVNQNDINSAKSKINSSNSGAEKSALQSQLQSSGYYPITGTFNVGSPNVTTSANVGAVANNVTVTETINYSMFGVHQSDLKTLVDNNVDGQIDTSKQSILSEGLDKASFNVNSQNNNSAQISMSTVAIAGPQLSIGSIQQSSKGERTGDVKSQLMNDPGVTSVNVSLSPFWRTTLPNSPNDITVNIAKPSGG
jgi:hypothetical protein